MANRKISDLTSLTAPDTGDLLPIVDISEAAAADKNKKITYAELLASAPAGSAAAPSFSFDADPNTGLFNPAADTLAFAEGGAEAARIDSSARLLVGLTSANTSGAKLQTSDGLTFPATAVASADPNTLDDYEEGTWTPVISNTGFTYTYSNQTGTYTKVGRKVTLSWRVAVTARSGSASGGLAIVAIPFTSSASFTGSALGTPQPAQPVIHKADTGSTSGIRTFLYSGLANSANSYFWIAAVATNGDPLDFGSDFHMGGVFTYEV